MKSNNNRKSNNNNRKSNYNRKSNHEIEKISPPSSYYYSICIIIEKVIIQSEKVITIQTVYIL